MWQTGEALGGSGGGTLQRDGASGTGVGSPAKGLSGRLLPLPQPPLRGRLLPSRELRSRLPLVTKLAVPSFAPGACLSPTPTPGPPGWSPRSTGGPFLPPKGSPAARRPPELAGSSPPARARVPAPRTSMSSGAGPALRPGGLAARPVLRPGGRAARPALRPGGRALRAPFCAREVGLRAAGLGRSPLGAAAGAGCGGRGGWRRGRSPATRVKFRHRSKQTLSPPRAGREQAGSDPGICPNKGMAPRAPRRSGFSGPCPSPRSPSFPTPAFRLPSLFLSRPKSTLAFRSVYLLSFLVPSLPLPLTAPRPALCP